jgi:uncharacterized protein YndB with AHSA1/START domain/GNAT superfamily N-acetyltransferase
MGDELEQVWEIEVPASAEEAWAALTRPELTSRYYFGMPVHSDWMPGSPVVYGDPANPAAEGTVLEADPPRRLRLRARLLITDRTREDPPHRLTWEIAPGPSGTSVRVTVDEYPGPTSTYHVNAEGMNGIVRGLKTLLDPAAQAGLRRLDQIEPCRVAELTPERLGDFLAFFDQRAFSDNAAWSGCYCMGDRFEGSEEEWSVRTGAQNRDAMSGLIRGRRAHGLLAYAGDKAVGWCSVAPRDMLPGVRRAAAPDPQGHEAVGAINCFVIDPRYRMHGIARQLLTGACELLAAQGCREAEAYPSRESDSAAHSFRGPLSLYLSAGFRPQREESRRLVVRKGLQIESPLATGGEEPG